MSDPKQSLADSALLNYFDELLTDVSEYFSEGDKPDHEVEDKPSSTVSAKQKADTQNKTFVNGQSSKKASESKSLSEESQSKKPEKIAAPTESVSAVKRVVEKPAPYGRVSPQPKPAPKEDNFQETKQAVLESDKRQQLQALLSKRVITTPDLLEESPVESEVKTEVLPTQEVELEIEKEEISEVDSKTSHLRIHEFLEWNENGRPHWAQEKFEVLLFDVFGLTLAVPLIALGQIQPLTDELTPIFGQSEWFMGILPTPTGKIRTVNTALFVMPEKYQERFLETAKYVISIDGLPWGLAVDNVNQPISLDPMDVKWRTSRTSRPWLAGTVKSAMCALIDIPQMAKQLVESDPKASEQMELS